MPKNLVLRQVKGEQHGATVHANSQNGTEAGACLFDGNQFTKWLAHKKVGAQCTIKLAEGPTKLAEYRVRSANDCPARDPGL